jgi:3'-phosphoadenosine 5'-phosphosulfate (PAPS) 3'-phosphatase
MKTISLLRLASTCIDAGRQGCEVIRSFHQVHQSAVGGTLKIGGDPRSVVTQCDIDAQAIIIAGLRETWGDEIKIIGEEDQDDADGQPLAPKVGSNATSLLRKDILFDHQEVHTVVPPDLDEEIPLDELVIFVDPVDGTREFVEGRLKNVACLIGIARNSRPIAGVIGVPFPDGDLSSETEIHYAVADQIKTVGVWPRKQQKECAANELLSNDDKSDDVADFTILTGDSSNPILQKATNCARSIAKGNVRHSLIGGTAAKLRLVATSTSPTIAILHFDTKLWDTCSAEVLLNCQGGKITDFFGAPLVHCPKRTFGNVFGVVASLGGSDLHDELCRSMRADGEVVHKIFKKWIGENSRVPEVSQAIDIARDLDGVPYGLEDLQQLLKNENPSNLSLVGYSVPEEDAWRGLMSNGARYKLDWKGLDNENSSSLPPRDIFCKRIVMAHLSHAQDKLKTAPHKVCGLVAMS